MNVDLIQQVISASMEVQDGLSGYVLVDPFVRNPFDSGRLKGLLSETRQVGIKNPFLGPGKAPILLKFSSKDVHILRESMNLALAEQCDPKAEQIEGFSIAGWLIGPSDPEIVSRHLAGCMNMPARFGAGRRTLRLGDRRVMEWMWLSLSMAQKNYLLGPLSAWWSIDRRGELVSYSKELRSRSSVSLSLTADQWSHAELCEFAQDIARGWQAFSEELPSDYIFVINEISRRILSLGFTNRLDRVVLASYALQIHKDIFDHPEVAELLAGVIEGSNSVTSALSSISDERWDGFRLDLNSHARADALEGYNNG